MVSPFVLLISLSGRDFATGLFDRNQASTGIWYGFYIDATSYEPGEAIEIYSSGPDVETVFRLVRLDDG